MKYSIYVKNYLKRKIAKNNPNISVEEAKKQANKEFKHMLLDAFYQFSLNNLSDKDPLKELELEDEFRFLDIHYESDQNVSIRNPYSHLYHGVRFDSTHEKFESILRNRKIKCANQANTYWRIPSDNCNEGEYVSLIDYSGDENDVEFKKFIEENISFIISPKLNPVKCKYLPYEEWKKIKKKLPKTRHRYSYAKHEYQYPDYIPFDYVEGILYPLRFNGPTKTKTKEDILYIKELLIKWGLEDLPILYLRDWMSGLICLDVEPNNNILSKRIEYNKNRW